MKNKTVFYCTECGNETPKWSGKCAACGAWNTLTEAPAQTTAVKTAGIRPSAAVVRNVPKTLSELNTGAEIRFSTGIGEFDRVLGGGAVRGSLVLVGGAPGIGKSTLLLQLCGFLQDEKVLYITGEESLHQLKMRAQRLNVSDSSLLVLSETDLSEAVNAINNVKPSVLIVDSVQTLYDPEMTSTPGSIAQVKSCTMTIMRLAKEMGFTAFIVGHVNKAGAIAGPKVLEHMVDCVLYFEGERSSSYRILRAAKNRFGSTNEIGVFEMGNEGLIEVENPSESLLSGRPQNAPGTCVTCVMEGSRPILAEIQALLTPTNYNAARRNSNGIDFNRAMLLLAVLEKRGGLAVGGCDTYINVIGGLELDEPAADLATVLAIASSFRDKPLGTDLAAVGEVGLTGELRSVNALDKRLAEIARIGFKRCIVPASAKDAVRAPASLQIIAAENIREAIKAAL